MKSIIAIALIYLTAVNAVNVETNELIVAEYEAFIAKYGKVYTEAERLTNFVTFKKNYENLLAEKEEHANSNAEEPFTKGVTMFFDITFEEFQKKYLNTNMSEFLNFYADCNEDFEVSGDEAPENLDYSTASPAQVNHVKNQGQCGSCWAFSTVASLEHQHWRKTGELLDFAEQQLVDCDSSNGGCNGGLMDTAFHYYSEVNVALTKDYHYTARDGRCKDNLVEHGVEVGVAGCTADHTADEEVIRQAVAKYGVLSIAVDANSFFNYHGGILRARAGGLNHGIAIVGYGVENDVPYWKVRNSWGTSWGEQGYARVYRGDNSIGINSYVLAALLN